MLKRFQISTSESDDNDVNVTPLLDIVFIMLIFFIVTSVFIREPGVEVQRPDAVTAEERRLVSVLVAITSDNRIWVDNREVPLEGVRTAVERLRRENPKGSAVIQADAGSHTRYLIEVLDQVEAAGVTDVAVAAKKS